MTSCDFFNDVILENCNVNVRIVGVRINHLLNSYLVVANYTCVANYCTPKSKFRIFFRVLTSCIRKVSYKHNDFQNLIRSF